MSRNKLEILSNRNRKCNNFCHFTGYVFIVCVPLHLKHAVQRIQKSHESTNYNFSNFDKFLRINYSSINRIFESGKKIYYEEY